MEESVDNFLAHYGVKGMKWGVRRDGKRGSSRKAKSSEPRSPGKVRRGGQKLKSKWDALDPETKDATKSLVAMALAGVGGVAYRNISSGHMPEIKRAKSFTEHFMSGGNATRPVPEMAKRRRGAYVTTTMRG